MENPNTARFAKLQADAQLRAAEEKLSDIREAGERQKQYCLGTLRAQHLERAEYVQLLLTQPDLLTDLGVTEESVDAKEFSRRIYSLAEALMLEGSRREVRELIDERKRLGESAGPALKSVARRLGVDEAIPSLVPG